PWLLLAFSPPPAAGVRRRDSGADGPLRARLVQWLDQDAPAAVRARWNAFLSPWGHPHRPRRAEHHVPADARQAPERRHRLGLGRSSVRLAIRRVQLPGVRPGAVAVGGAAVGRRGAPGDPDGARGPEAYRGR